MHRTPPKKNTVLLRTWGKALGALRAGPYHVASAHTASYISEEF